MNNENQNTVRISTETVTKTFATVIINGRDYGKREINGGPSLLSFAQGIAKEFGINSFNVVMDGTPVTPGDPRINAPVPAASTVAVSAKDSRGFADGEETTEEAIEEAVAEVVAEQEAAAGESGDEADITAEEETVTA